MKKSRFFKWFSLFGVLSLFFWTAGCGERGKGVPPYPAYAFSRPQQAVHLPLLEPDERARQELSSMQIAVEQYQYRKKGETVLQSAAAAWCSFPQDRRFTHAQGTFAGEEGFVLEDCLRFFPIKTVDGPEWHSYRSLPIYYRSSSVAADVTDPPYLYLVFSDLPAKIYTLQQSRYQIVGIRTGPYSFYIDSPEGETTCFYLLAADPTGAQWACRLFVQEESLLLLPLEELCAYEQALQQHVDAYGIASR